MPNTCNGCELNRWEYRRKADDPPKIHFGCAHPAILKEMPSEQRKKMKVPFRDGLPANEQPAWCPFLKARASVLTTIPLLTDGAGKPPVRG